MPRLQKVFKKRKGKYYPRKNTINSKICTFDIKLNAQAEHTHDSKQSCAKEKKIPDLNESCSSFGDSVGKSGLAITFVLKCFACPYRVKFSSSNFHEGTQIATINTRFVYAMRSIGKGAEAGRMFCGVMNLPQPPTRFSPYVKRILNAAKLVYEDSIQNAAKEAICENEGNKNIAVAVDGTWQKRGYTSLNGVVTVTRAFIQVRDGDRFNSCQVIYSQFGLAIHQNHHQARRRIVEWAPNEIAVVPDFHKRILFSDEAHFWLNGFVNKQYCRIWSEANPQVYVEKPLHPEKLTVWCALWAGGIICPYFFKNDEGHNELWFQQDGATCHTARVTIDLLKDRFDDCLISRFGHVNWPPRSCDLTPLDYFLWGYVKSLVHADKPQTLDHLEDNIRRVIADIRPQMLEKVIENWTSRLDYIRASRGSHMPEIIFKIDEAHFWLNGYVNKQNCRIWSEANPQVYVETPLHPEKLTVWCALWAGGIIGPYFFKNNEGHNVTVNGDRYRAMITNFFIPELSNHDVQELWFQQDGATCHTARVTIDLLKDRFDDCLISRFGPLNWPPRSCDLTPLDYFMWGYVKSLVYADKPQTLDHLEDNIRRVIADIRPQMLDKVIENWTSRLDYIRASLGSHIPEIIFKT
ncbi:putative transposable element [Trichonephila clavipes]|nr:putative transposable element [Trichonephila clavipes]